VVDSVDYRAEGSIGPPLDLFREAVNCHECTRRRSARPVFCNNVLLNESASGNRESSRCEIGDLRPWRARPEIGNTLYTAVYIRQSPACVVQIGSGDGCRCRERPRQL